MVAIDRMLRGGRAAGSPSTLAWGVSLFAHLCAGVACCFVTGSAPAPAELAEGPALAEVPVAVVWVPRPEVERAAERKPPEEASPESLTLQPVPAFEPPAVPLPAPAREVVVTLLPPEPSDEPLALSLASAPPPVAEMAPPAPEVAEPSAPAATLCAVEPAAGLVPRLARPAVPEEGERTVGQADRGTAREAAREAPSAPAVVLAAAPSPNNVPPAYPRAARRRGHEGLVVVSARVSPSGACVAAAILRSSGHRELDEAAAEAVRAWQFRPALRDGTPVEAELEIPIRFRLAD
ncbi:MAG: energy transducer TonB [Planctomycetes bacterium]|nr:energy transducer TonB [Planctomycetota bacterium]